MVASMVDHATAARRPGSSRCRAVFPGPVPGVPNECGVPRESYPDRSGGGDAATGRCARQWDGHGKRQPGLAGAAASALAGARYARAAGVALLAAAAVGQAVARTLTTASAPATGGAGRRTVAALGRSRLEHAAAALPARAGRHGAAARSTAPAMAALAVTFGNAVAFVSFGQVDGGRRGRRADRGLVAWLAARPVTCARRAGSARGSGAARGQSAARSRRGRVPGRRRSACRSW